jgi:hypothetical protein
LLTGLLCLELDEDAVRGNAVAKGLCKTVRSFSCIALTSFLMEVIP